MPSCNVMVEKPEHVIDFQIHVNVFFHPAVEYMYIQYKLQCKKNSKWYFFFNTLWELRDTYRAQNPTTAYFIFIFANAMHDHNLTNALKSYLHANMLSQFHK